MAKTETAELQVATRSWLPPLDGGTALMAVLIGFMGFYVLYPLILILINSFNTATIAEPPAYGLKAWQEAFSEPGIWRSLWNSVKIGWSAGGRLPTDFYLLAAGAHQYFLPALDSASGYRFTRPRHDLRLDVDARPSTGLINLAAPAALRFEFRHLFVLGHHLGPCHGERYLHQSHVDDAGVPAHGCIFGRGQPDVRRQSVDDFVAHHHPSDDAGDHRCSAHVIASSAAWRRAFARRALGLLRLLDQDR
jgi:hypothetical protein